MPPKFQELYCTPGAFFTCLYIFLLWQHLSIQSFTLFSQLTFRSRAGLGIALQEQVSCQKHNLLLKNRQIFEKAVKKNQRCFQRFKLQTLKLQTFTEEQVNLLIPKIPAEFCAAVSQQTLLTDVYLEQHVGWKQ